MTIYVDISAAVHGRAGLGRYAESLAGALVSELPEQLAVFYNRNGSVTQPISRLKDVPVRTVRAGYKPWRMAVWMGQLAGVGFDRLLDQAELYHATEHLLMPLRRIPTVLTVHDLIFHLFPQHHKRLNYWYLNTAMPLFCRRASAIIAVSASTKRDIVERYGIEKDKVTVIYEAAAPHFKPPTDAEVERVRASYHLPERYLLHVGTIEPRKNLVRLLEAVHTLRKRGIRIDVVVVGSKGWLYEDFFRQIETLDMTDVVHLPGYVVDADLPAVFGGATLVCVPSLYEGFGLPVLEAMACGAPVVCSGSSSLPEVGGQAARYFHPTDVGAMAEEILTVWQNGEVRAAMSQAGLNRSSEFSWQRAARETISVYNKLLNQPRHS